MIPDSINENTFITYKAPETIEINRKIKAENFNWTIKQPKNLNAICIESLSKNWLGTPKIDELVVKDREYFLRNLNVEAPLKTLVDNIKNDIFWKRYYFIKWPESTTNSEPKKWINIFMERYFAEYLENLNPRLYDPEEINKLVKLCGPYIQKLSIRSLVPTDVPVERTVSPEMMNLITGQKQIDIIETESNDQNLIRDHISLHAALGSLSNLVELHITYQLKHIGVNYRKDQFQFTNADAKNLAYGLEKCFQLRIFRLTRSDMNCQRVKYILRGLTNNERLETLDFSHCKIGDQGMLAISKFITRHNTLRSLLLVDNAFGSNGAEALSHSLNNTNCGIRNLDLRLNNNLGSNGVAHIAVSIARGCNLTSLNISGCGITPGPLSKAPAGVWSATSAENPPSFGDLLARAIGLAKTPLRSLDISVNNIGSPSDHSLANAICLSYLVDINLKRSGMGSLPMAIAEAAAAAQRLRREAEKGIRFKRSAGRVLQARRVARGMNIDTDPILLAHQISARPSIVSVTSEEGTYSMQTQPLPSDFGFVPVLKSPIHSSRASSVTGPPTSRRSSHHIISDPVQDIRRSALIRRGSDGSLLQTKSSSVQKHIKIFVSNTLYDTVDD